MTVQVTIPRPIRLRRRWLYLAAATVLAAATTGAVLAFAVDTGTETAGVAVKSGASALSAQEQTYANMVGSLTPAQLQGIRYYWTPGSTSSAGK